MATSSKETLVNGAISGATTNTDRKQLAARCHSFLGWLNLTAIGAGSTLNAKIQHSVDGENWTDLVSFAALAAPGTELKTITAPVGHQVRGVLALAGGVLTGTAKLEIWFDPDR
jgi:hypothetical protein